MWDAQTESLAGDFSILRYDQRGHGGTPLVAPCTFDSLARDLIAVLDAAGANRAALAGASMGAVTVLRAAALAPDRVSRVVAADGQWRNPPSGHAAWQARIDAAMVGGVGSLAAPTVARWFLPGLSQRDPALFERVRQMIATTSLAGYVGCAKALQSYDFSDDYAVLPTPVLFLVGAEDGPLVETMRAMAEATPGARYTVIKEAGHLPNLEQPARFLKAVRPFLLAEPRP